MPKTKISEFSATPGNNTDIDGINIAEGCAPSGINDAIRELMAQLKDFQAGTAGDSFNGPVGTSTAAAGAFTTLSSTGNTTLGDASGDAVTINGATTFVNVSPTITPGTANGVAYLNGSKVLTTGSALTFDSSNRLSVNQSSSLFGAQFEVTGGAAGQAIGIHGRASDGIGNIVFGANGLSTEYARIQSDNTSSLQFGVGASGSEQMRLTSTGLGIGTSSPVRKLDIYDATAPTFALHNSTSGTGSTDGFLLFTLGADTTLVNYENGYMAFSTNATERARITSGGDVGIGTSSPSGKLHVSGDALANTFKLIANTTVSGSDATIFRPADNTMAFSTNGAERLRIDSSGNLGLGVTPSAWVGMQGGVFQNAGSGSLFSRGVNEFCVGFNAYYNSSTGYKYINSRPASNYQQTDGAHLWFNAASGTAGNAISFTQAMTLDASGNLSVGSTSAVGRFTLENSATTTEITLRSTGGVGTNNRARIIAGYEAGGSDYGGYLAFNTTSSSNVNTERARITSGGNLLVGATAVPSASVAGFCATGTSSGNITSSGSSTSAYNHWVFYNGNGLVGYISTSGSTTTYSTSSDYRLKENIQPMTGALAKVAQLKPCTYNWKADGSDGEGFIAHELAEVVPQCVTGEKDAVDEDGKPVYQGIDTSFLVATLAAAIKELKAEFDAYKATHP